MYRLIWRIHELPRVNLITLPTPLEKAVNLSREYGVELYVKRDDVMELAFGGNKVRKLEFIFGEVLSKGYNVVITRGSYYSNHVRLTAAAARKYGLDVYIVTYPPRAGVEKLVQGNILLYRIFGAHVVEVADSSKADEKMVELKDDLEGQGFKPYIIPVYSVNGPATISCSPSTMSKGNLPEDINIATKKTIAARGFNNIPGIFCA